MQNIHNPNLLFQNPATQEVDMDSGHHTEPRLSLSTGESYLLLPVGTVTNTAAVSAHTLPASSGKQKKCQMSMERSSVCAACTCGTGVPGTSNQPPLMCLTTSFLGGTCGSSVLENTGVEDNMSGICMCGTGGASPYDNTMDTDYNTSSQHRAAPYGHNPGDMEEAQSLFPGGTEDPEVSESGDAVVFKLLHMKEGYEVSPAGYSTDNVELMYGHKHESHKRTRKTIRRTKCRCVLLVTVGFILTAMVVAIAGVATFLHFRSKESNLSSSSLLRSHSSRGITRAPVVMDPTTSSITSSPSTTISPRSQVADRLTRILDASVQPCEDFYTFSCGHFEYYLRDISSTARHTPTDLFGVVQEMVDNHTIALLLSDKLTDSRDSSSDTDKLRQVFRKCTVSWSVSQEECLRTERQIAQLAIERLSFSAPFLRDLDFDMEVARRSLRQTYTHLVDLLENSLKLSMHTKTQMQHSLEITLKRAQVGILDDMKQVLLGEVAPQLVRDPVNKLIKRLVSLLHHSQRSNDTSCQVNTCQLNSAPSSPCLCLDIRQNKLTLKPSLLALPLFHRSLPPELQMSYLVPLLAEQLFHSVGPQRRVELYSAFSDAKLNEVYSCFSRLLSVTHSHFSTGTGVSGDRVGGQRVALTVHKLVAMYMGLKVGYQTLRSVLDLSENTESAAGNMPSGLQAFTREQLFYINWAQTYCRGGSVRDIQKYRVLVNSAVRTLGHFAVAFQCTLDTAMHPHSVTGCEYP